MFFNLNNDTMTTEQNEIKSAEWRKKNLSKNSFLANVSCRFYRGYTIRNHGYYPPDKCVRWEAVNDDTGEADFHAKRLRDIISLINEALGVQNGS